MAKVVTRFFTDIEITTSGVEVFRIFGNDYRWRGVNGYIQQIIIQRTAGTSTTISALQIRYQPGSSAATNLVHSITSESLTSNVYIEDNIRAPFSLMKPNTAQDLIVFAQADATGTFTIRIDMEMYE